MSRGLEKRRKFVYDKKKPIPDHDSETDETSRTNTEELTRIKVESRTIKQRVFSSLGRAKMLKLNIQNYIKYTKYNTAYKKPKQNTNKIMADPDKRNMDQAAESLCHLSLENDELGTESSQL